MANELKIVLKGRFNTGDQTRNVFYIQSAGGVIPQNADVASWLGTIFHAGMLSGVSANWAAYAVDTYQWLNGYWTFTDSFTSTIAGTAGGNPDAQQMAYVLVARTSVKRVVPKKFFAGVVPAAHNQGLIMPATLAALNTSATAWATGFTSAGNQQTPGTWTKSHMFTSLVAARADIYLGTQRRRKQGVGF